MISKPGNKTAASQWPCPQSLAHSYNTRNLLICRSGANSTSSAKLYQPFLTTKICHSFVSQTNCIDVDTISMKHLISTVRWCSQQPILCLRNMRTSADSGDMHALWEVTISPAEETHVYWEHLFPAHTKHVEPEMPGGAAHSGVSSTTWEDCLSMGCRETNHNKSWLPAQPSGARMP